VQRSQDAGAHGEPNQGGAWANEHNRPAAAILDRQTFYLDVEHTYRGIKDVDLVPNLSPQNMASVEIGKDFMLSHGYIKNDFDVGKWAAPEFLEQAAKELIEERWKKVMRKSFPPCLQHGSGTLEEANGRPARRGSGGERMVIAVNYAPHPSQCYLKLALTEIGNRSVRLRDSLSSACYTREGNQLLERGLFLDLQPRSHHAFDLEISQ
jgi:hypothetical protein